MHLYPSLDSESIIVETKVYQKLKQCITYIQNKVRCFGNIKLSSLEIQPLIDRKITENEHIDETEVETTRTEMPSEESIRHHFF